MGVPDENASGSYVKIYVGSDDTGNYAISGATSAYASVTADQWNHIAFSRNGNSWTIFTNGTAATSSTNSQSLIPSNADYKVSIGHIVISGGEVPAMYMLEAFIRRIPGVLGNPDSLKYETFNDNKYDFPVYTRPETFKNLSVPEVLLSGNHKDIEEWKKNNLKDI